MDEEPPQEQPPSDIEQAVEGDAEANVTLEPQGNQLGARGRKLEAKRVARQANAIRKTNNKHLKAKVSFVDQMAKRYDNLPQTPNGHFAVCPEHAWAKIHGPHDVIVTYAYASCMKVWQSITCP